LAMTSRRRINDAAVHPLAPLRRPKGCLGAARGPWRLLNGRAQRTVPQRVIEGPCASHGPSMGHGRRTVPLWAARHAFPTNSSTILPSGPKRNTPFTATGMTPAHLMRPSMRTRPDPYYEAARCGMNPCSFILQDQAVPSHNAVQVKRQAAESHLVSSRSIVPVSSSKLPPVIYESKVKLAPTLWVAWSSF